MDYDFDAKRLPYLGWEVRSRLTHVSPDGTVAAGAELFIDQILMCHLISCRQFVDGSEAIRAIELKATLWIDERESHARTSDDAPALLS